MKHTYRTIAAALLVCAANVNTARAQDSGWHYLVAPYIMFPNMKGETGIGELPLVSVDEDPSDIFENLQMGAMLYAEAYNDTWAFSSDVLYMNLESDFAGGTILNDGSVEMAQVGWELAAMRRLTPCFELGLAATYNQIDADLKIHVLNTPVKISTTEDWVDPSIVARATFPFGEKWFFQARGNIGGFGVGSDLMWQLQADVVYKRSDRWSFMFGYRVIDFDYDHGSG